jgi:hypothetical protein
VAVVMMVLTAAFLALHGFAVMVAMRAVLGAVAVGACGGGAEAADGEGGADGGKDNDPAYALRHDSPFAGRAGLCF